MSMDQMVMIDYAMFIISAVIAVFGATMMIAQRNPVASVLYLILSLVAQAALYVQLGALFLGAILVVVYAGAIMVLFLFVIMLLNLRGEEENAEDKVDQTSVVSRFSKFLIGSLFLVELLFIVIKGQSILAAIPVGASGLPEVSETFGSIKTVATRMFREYLYPFELTGILMLIAIVGAVVIAKQEAGDDDDTETEQLTKGGN